MKYLLIFLIVIGVLSLIFWKNDLRKSDFLKDNIEVSKTIQNDLGVKNEMIVSDKTQELKIDFVSPLDRIVQRVNKKRFGDFINPSTSPVQPENFSGFHTGIDLEIFADELDSDVIVKAMCTGRILQKEYAGGYGGVLVQSCVLNNETVSVIYGHLNLFSIDSNIGDELGAGDKLGLLGKAYSSETSGERKHLHLGIHRGESVNILGYVQTEAELSGWIDPCVFICR